MTTNIPCNVYKMQPGDKKVREFLEMAIRNAGISKTKKSIVEVMGVQFELHADTPLQKAFELLNNAQKTAFNKSKQPQNIM